MNNDQRDENIPLMKMEKNKGKFEYQRTISSIKDPQVSLSPSKNYRFANYKMFRILYISVMQRISN